MSEMWSHLSVLLVWVIFSSSGVFLLSHAQGSDSAGQLPGETILKGNIVPEDDFPTTPLPPPAEFVVYDREMMPCLLVLMDTTLVIEPKRTAGKKIVIPVPKSAEARGSCGHGEDSKLILSWRSFQFMWHFQKSRVSDAWYVDNIELTYNTSDKAFGNITQEYPGQVRVMHSADPLTLFLTPIGRSYACNLVKDVKLFDDKKIARVTIKLSRFRAQPFAAMTHRQYGDDFKCPEEAGRRDETVPLIVGGLLALSVLGTIGGYGGYRYFKVKKIEYDTME